MDYKRMIVEMLQKIDDEKVLSFIYKIISNLVDQGVYPQSFFFGSIASSFAIFSSTAHSFSSSLDKVKIRRVLKESSSSLKRSEVNLAISSSLVIGRNISPAPVRSQSSFTLNSLHIKEITASLGVFFPVSQQAILLLDVLNLSANPCWVRLSVLRNSLILSFKLSPSFCIQNSTQKTNSQYKNVVKRQNNA